MQSFLCLALSNAIVATLLAAFVAVVTRFCRRPSVRHALWLLVLLKLITPPLVPFSVTWPHSEEIVPLPAEPTPSILVLAPVSEPSEPIASDEETSPTSPQRQQGQEEPLLALRAGEVLIALWIGGALMWWAVAAVRLRKFRRLLGQARPATAEVQEQGRRLALVLGLRHCPPIVFVSGPLSPILWALGFSPRLLLPAELWRKLTVEQQDTLLAHELAHLRRGDHWVRRLELLVLGLYWWHPVVWWARRRLQEAEEECCDALVIAFLPDAAPDYASALVQTVAFLSQTRPAALVGASGAGQVPLLKRRLTMILTETPSHKPSRIGFWIVLGMGALLLPLAPQAARTEALDEPASADEKPLSLALDFGFPLADAAHHRDIENMAGCSACHQLPMPAHGFHGKPQSWREAHDEIVRLMDELRRRQAEFNKATKPQPVAASPDHSEEIEKLQDQIELLKVQVRLKEARVAATQATLKEYKRRLANYENIVGTTPGAIPRDTLQETQIIITTQEGQLQINEAELQESLVRLKQAERRLARLQPAKNQYELAPKESWNVTWAEALFDKRIVHHGTVKQGVGVVSTFRMTNHGQHPVHISGIRSSAGALKVRDSTQDLPPAGQGMIVTQLDTNQVLGEVIRRIVVQFDKPDRQEVVLEVRVNVQAADAAKPQNPERLQELEKKLDELRKEMENLRREMRPDKPSVPGQPKNNNRGQGASTPRQKRMIRWSLRFNNENGAEYVAQLHALNATLAVPSSGKDDDPQYKIIRDLAAKPATLSDDNQIMKSSSVGIIWKDDDSKAVAGVMSALGLTLRPSHFIAILPAELDQKLFRLEKEYLNKHHAGRSEDEIVETTFRMKRVGSAFEPEVAGQRIR